MDETLIWKGTIFKKYSIKIPSTNSDVIQQFEKKLQDYKFYLRVAYKKKEKLLNSPKFYHNEEFNIKSINVDIIEAERLVTDLNDEILLFTQYINSHDETNKKDIESPDNAISDIERRMFIEKEVRDASRKMIQVYEGKYRKAVEKVCKESEIKIRFLENQFNRIKKSQMIWSSDYSNESPICTTYAGKLELELMELKSRFMINRAILIGCRKTIGCMKDKNEALMYYREVSQKMYIYQKALQSLIERLPDDCLIKEDEDVKDLLHPVNEQIHSLEERIKDVSANKLMTTNMLYVSGMVTISFKGCPEINQDFPPAMVVAALGSGFRANTPVLYKTAKQSRSHYTFSSEASLEAKLVIKVDRVAVFETSYWPIVDKVWKDCVDLNLDRSKEIELQIYCKTLSPKSKDRVWVLAAYTFIKAEEFLNQSEKSLELNLYPSGTLLIDVKFSNPVIKKCLERKRHQYSRQRGQYVMRSTEMGISQYLWNRLMSNGNKILLRAKSYMRKHSIVHKIQRDANVDNVQSQKRNVASNLVVFHDEEKSQDIDGTSNIGDISEELPSDVVSCDDTELDTGLIKSLLTKEKEDVKLQHTRMSKRNKKSNKQKSNDSGGVLGAHHFELISVLGSGNFGKVILARHIATNQYYALKALSKEMICDTNEFITLQSEKRILQRSSMASNPFLINLMACFQTKDKVIFVMDYMPGGDLMFHLIHSEIMKESSALFYASCVVLGLEYLHSNDIMYRDVKADNLLIGHDGYIKLADFGLSKENMSYDTQTKTFCGTAEYMAPEIINYQGYTRAADWWAVGVLLHIMMVKEYPFSGSNDDETFALVCQADPKYTRSLSIESKRLIRMFLRIEPEKRLGSSESGTADVKKEFSLLKIDFDRIFEKKIKAPFIPRLSSSVDVSHFDEDCAKEQPNLEKRGCKVIRDDCFNDFDYVSDQWIHN